MEYIVICHFIRKGYIIGIYDTFQKAEKKFNDTLNFRININDGNLNNMLLQNSINTFKIKTESRYEFGRFNHTTDGEFTIGICQPKVDSTIFIKQYITKMEFQETLFDVKLLDEMEDQNYLI